MAYREIYAKWQADPDAFWLEAAGAIDWVHRPTHALNATRAPLYQWFTDSTVNTCWNAVDRHVLAGRAGHGIVAYLRNDALSGGVGGDARGRCGESP